MTTLEILKRAKEAKQYIQNLTTEEKNNALKAMADCLEEDCDHILIANQEDLECAKKQYTSVMLDRLALTKERIIAMANGIREVCDLPDPVGKVISSKDRGDGLLIQKVSVAMGVVAIIYESRPNVTSDAAALAFKSGNVCILRTGKEAHRSATKIMEAMQRGLKRVSVYEYVINLVEDTSRNSAYELMTAVGFVDLLIPRGGANLIKACVEQAKVPCIQTGTGICHAYVDKDADFEKALKIVDNAKTSRPSVCNALEVCLVHREIANDFLPLLWKRLHENREYPVKFLLNSCAYEVLKGYNDCELANENDFDCEFLDYKIAVAVVDSVQTAISHIAQHSTGHSECIVTENESTAKLFTMRVDSAAVYVNASTRFTDGGEFGLGCEIGISTQKLHARGPMGLEELTTYKYVIYGNGHIR